MGSLNQGALDAVNLLKAGQKQIAANLITNNVLNSQGKPSQAISPSDASYIAGMLSTEEINNTIKAVKSGQSTSTMFYHPNTASADSKGSPPDIPSDGPGSSDTLLIVGGLAVAAGVIYMALRR